jgi:hypothetical protein
MALMPPHLVLRFEDALAQRYIAGIRFKHSHYNTGISCLGVDFGL